MEVGIATATTLDAPGYTIGGTSITVASTSNMPTNTGIIFAIDTIDANGEQVAGSYNEYAGTVASATSITNVSHQNGTDRNYSAGATTRVYVPVSAERENRIVEWGLVEHAQDGTHTDITTDSINNAGTLTQTGAATITGALTLKNYDGWITPTQTWTYASGDGTNVGTFTVSGVDLTGVYNVGDRVKFTQTTVKYGIITKVAFSTDTTVTIYMGTDYTIANAAITSPAYSHDKSPVGFPMSPTKWTITKALTTDRSTNSTSWATLTDTITVPIGAFRISAKYPLMLATSTSTRSAAVTLSSDASTETNTDLTGRLRNASNVASGWGNSVYVETTVLLTSSTTFTLMGISDNADSTIKISNTNMGAGFIKAVSAYL